jgi:hypothetical protein
MQARWGTHGDHATIAYAPSSVQECYEGYKGFQHGGAIQAACSDHDNDVLATCERRL